LVCGGVGGGGGGCIHLAQYRGRCWVLVYTALNLRVLASQRERERE
jgi:hypothetical protein